MRKGDVVAIDARHSVDRGLLHLATRLDPIIGDRLRSELDGLPWTSVLVELDRMRGKTAKNYASTDLQSQLRMITERLGNLGFPFDDHSRQVSTLGNELRIVRNKWAHQDEFTLLDAWRTQYQVHGGATRTLPGQRLGHWHGPWLADCGPRPLPARADPWWDLPACG